MRKLRAKGFPATTEMEPALLLKVIGTLFTIISTSLLGDNILLTNSGAFKFLLIAPNNDSDCEGKRSEGIIVRKTRPK